MNHRKAAKEKRRKSKKILVIGGFGYHNVGDEAQLDGGLERLGRLFPDYGIKVLSPNPDDTCAAHGHCLVGAAPRIAFFRAGESKLYSIKPRDQEKGFVMRWANRGLKILYLLKSEWLLFNAALDRKGLPTVLLSSDASALLYELHSCRLVYFNGGGYLTGDTLSRLWDGILLCRMAKVYKIPVVMSGQTMGLWRTRFTRAYARRGFSRVRLIAVRDASQSVKQLAQIGIKGKHVYPVCDDALFCGKEDSSRRLQEYFVQSRCNFSIDEKFMAVNIHDWGMHDTSSKTAVVNRLAEVLESLEKMMPNLLFIPMTPTDVDMMDLVNEKRPDRKVPILTYAYDYKIIRGILARAFCCVTMKHHPIIFGIGENTPCISLNYADYYFQKNGGALALLGQTKYQVNLMDGDAVTQLERLFQDLRENYDEIRKEIVKILAEKKRQTSEFEKELAQIVKRES